ncbi:MAG: OsmC family protein [Armatimonadetes bacterium]|nr:OsmC family protein [Armatimonadota bacterium]
MGSYKCETYTKWKGEKKGRSSAPDKPDIEVAAPPELKGHFGVWTPKEMLIAACESDMMLTFLALADQAGLKVVSYESRAVAELEGDPASPQLLKVDIYPDVEVTSKGDKALKILSKLQESCLTAGSLKAQVHVYPKLRATSARRSEKIIHPEP